jgi:hypothetical protein
VDEQFASIGLPVSGEAFPDVGLVDLIPFGKEREIEGGGGGLARARVNAQVPVVI